MSMRAKRPDRPRWLALASGALLVGAIWTGSAGAVLGADPPTGEVIYVYNASTATQLVVRPDGSGLTSVGCTGDRTHQGAPRRALTIELTAETFPTVSGSSWWTVRVAELVSRADGCGDPIVLWAPGPGYQFDAARWSLDGSRVALSGRHWDARGQLLEQGIWVGDVGGSCGSALCDVHLAVAFPMLVELVRPDGLVAYRTFGAQARWFPDGRRVAYARAVDPTVASPVQGIFVADVGLPGQPGAGERRVSITGVAGSVYSPDVAPDGTDRIAFWMTTSPRGTVQNDVFVVPASGGAPRQVTSARSANLLQLGGPGWSPDGKWIAFDAHTNSVNGRAIYRIAADGKTKPVLVAAQTMTMLYFGGWRR